MEKSIEILNKFWGYNAFRPLQEEIVDSVIYGHDTFAILPTGGGKSICFQVPGIALEGVTLVISPLIALMQDQVSNLEQRGIRANLITGAMSYREIDITLDNARFGNTKFLYTSPERLKSELFIERFKCMNIGLIVVDEAHCISEWGHDFRPAYKEIAAIRQWHPNAPMIALTASATTKVQDDIVALLELKHPKRFNGSLKRDNLHYRVSKSDNKLEAILAYCKSHMSETGIVYCQTRKSVKFLVTQLRAHGISAGMYHGGMNSDDRSYMLNEWMQDKIQVMVATNAFGMGIDKADVRYVLHYEIPNSLEAYYQEAGRAGRDEKDAEAIAFWEISDINLMQEQLVEKYPEKERIKAIYNSISNFLKVAIGAAKDETYPIDLTTFSKTFNLPIKEVFYALKILERNGTLQFSESNYHPTRVKFAIGNEALYKFQVSHTNLAKTITFLTRSYPGIFDRFISIHENEICKRLELRNTEFRKQLEFLEEYGVIDIHFQSNMPMITYLHERMADSHFSISNDVYDNRKEIEHNKLDSIVNYLEGESCRTSMIASYFGDTSDACDHCDNCMQETASKDAMINSILNALPSSYNELEHTLHFSSEQLKLHLHQLMKEELIYFDNERYYRA